nr:hypothetical protein [Ponticaulis sp.]
MAQIRETKGAFVGTGPELTAEAVAAKWDQITDTSELQAFDNGGGHTGHFIRLVKEGKS